MYTNTARILTGRIIDTADSISRAALIMRRKTLQIVNMQMISKPRKTDAGVDIDRRSDDAMPTLSHIGKYCVICGGVAGHE